MEQQRPRHPDTQKAANRRSGRGSESISETFTTPDRQARLFAQEAQRQEARHVASWPPEDGQVWSGARRYMKTPKAGPPSTLETPQGPGYNWDKSHQAKEGR
jgi:hypothetical protein